MKRNYIILIMLLLPLLLFAADWLLAADIVVDVHLHDTYFIINSRFCLTVLLLLLLPCMVLQVLLRIKKRPVTAFDYIHAAGTLLLFITGWLMVRLLLTGVHSLPRRYTDLSAPSGLLAGQESEFFVLVLLLLVLLQLVFAGYALVKLLRKPA